MTDEEELQNLKEKVESLNRFSQVNILISPRYANTPFNFERGVKMPFEEFEERYLHRMKYYVLSREDKTMPPCALCGEEIPGIKHLRTYEGEAYHPNCFEEKYDESVHDDLMKEYFNRVLDLDYL